MTPNKLFIIIFTLILLFSSKGISQTFEIQGKINNAENKSVEGVTVFLHELNRWTSSDANGNFKFDNIKKGSYHLHVHLIGYKSKTLTVKVDNDNIDLKIVMSSSSLELNAVLIEESITKSGQAQQTQPINVVDEEYMLKNANSSFVKILESIPGVSSINTGMGISKPVIRGLGFNRVVVAQNGIKQEGQQWGGDHGLEIDQFNVDRVEVVKGPASLMYGSDGIGGVVNIRPPAFPANNTVVGSALMTYRSMNDFIGTSVMAGINKNNNFFRIRVSSQDYADYKVPASEFTYNNYVLDLYNNRLKNTAGKERNLSVMTGINRKWGYSTITYSYFNQDAGFFAGSHGTPRAYQLFDDGDVRNIDLPYQSVIHQKVVSNSNIIIGHSWLEIDAGYQSNMRREFSVPHAHGFEPVSDSNLEHQFHLQTYSANLRLHSDQSNRSSRVIGVSGNAQKNDIAGFSFLIPDFVSRNAGAFVYQQYKLRDSVFVNAGIRYDYGHVSTNRFMMSIYGPGNEIIGQSQRSPAVDKDFNNVSGSAGISFFPSQSWNIKINVGSSFRLPTAPELTANGIHHGSFRHEMGDSTLSSERGYQFDLTVRHDKKNFTASFTPFFNYFDQFIFLDPTNQFSLLPDANLIYQFNQADALHTGAEFFADLHLTDQFHLSASGQYVFALNLETGYAMPFTPPASGRVEAEYEIGTKLKKLPKFSLGTNVEWATAQNRVARNEPATPGFYLLNFNSLLDLRFGKQKVKLALAIQNILNTKYFVHLNRYRLLNLPEAGRNFMVTIILPFERKI
jgi:iron complex outermembrane receptor protein